MRNAPGIRHSRSILPGTLLLVSGLLLFSVIPLLAQNGFAQSHFLSGVKAYNNGEYDKAVELLTRAAKWRNTEAALFLGEIYLEGAGEIAREPARAAKWIRIAAVRGNPRAMMQFAYLYERGLGVPQDFVEAVLWYERAGEAGQIVAAMNAARMHFNGVGNAVPRDRERSARYYMIAAEHGSAESMYNLGLMSLKGKGLEQNMEIAIEWFYKAAVRGEVKSRYYLGMAYLKGDGVPRDSRRAADWLQRAADLGYAEAMLQLGYMYHEGDGVEVDHQKALYWYKKAASRENAVAFTMLGEFYVLGKGVKFDYAVARSYFMAAALQGYPRALYNLGVLYYKGLGVEKDIGIAIDWFRKADNLEYAPAAQALSTLR